MDTSIEPVLVYSLWQLHRPAPATSTTAAVTCTRASSFPASLGSERLFTDAVRPRASRYHRRPLHVFVTVYYPVVPEAQPQGRVHRALTREAHSGVYFLAPPSRRSGDRSSRSFHFDAELQNDLRSVCVQFRQKELWLSLNISSRFLFCSHPISNSAVSFLFWQLRVMGSNSR
jgi:hypothetical protein